MSCGIRRIVNGCAAHQVVGRVAVTSAGICDLCATDFPWVVVIQITGTRRSVAGGRDICRYL